MRILLVNQFYWPELAATSQLLTDLTRHLAAQGHEVTVICAKSEYAGEDSTVAPEGVKILRVPDAPFGRSKIARMFSYGSFLPAALWLALRAPKQDLVVTLTTPPLVSLTGNVLKLFSGVTHWIWEMDMYPDVAVDLGVCKPNSLFTKIIGAVADWSRARADGIIALGECMRERLESRGVPSRKIFIAENWANSDRIHPGRRPAEHPVEIVYPGNLGLGHDVATISAAIEHFKDDDRIRFTFVGGGSGYLDLRAFCTERKIENVNFLGYENPDELTLLLNSSHVGLVTQKPSCVGSIVPSKIYAMMAAGLPLLFIGPERATPARTISRFDCGWHFECGETPQLINLLERLAEDPRIAQAPGERSCAAFLSHFDRPIAVSRICTILSIPQEATDPVTAPLTARSKAVSTW